MLTRTFCAVAVVALACLAPAQARQAAHHTLPVHQDNGVHPALWTVHGHKGTAYLFGSVHVLPSGIDWKSQTLLAAMRRSDTFVFEVPFDHHDQDVAEAARIQQEIQDQHGLLPPGESLRRKLPSVMVPKYDALIANLDISPGYLDRLQPWLAASVLETAQFFRSDASALNGVDVQVYALASNMHKETRGFETFEQQLAILGPEEQRVGIHELGRIIDQATTDNEKREYDAMVAAWERGDVVAIRKETDAGFANDPALRKTMLDDRTARWATALSGSLDTEPRTFFITVGAAHLVGPKGLPELMRKAGYKVDGPLEPAPTPALDRIVRKLAPKKK
jgi:uncharacterized protein YbaP (TraB family)